MTRKSRMIGRERAPRQTYGYQERNEPEREAFREKLFTVDKKRRVYVDEAGFDNRDDYPYGYNPRGERCYALKCGKKRKRSSWISALKEGKIFAPLTFEGCCNRDLFEAWLSQTKLDFSIGTRRYYYFQQFSF